MVPFLNGNFYRNSYRVLTLILLKRLWLLHVLALNGIHLATPILNYFSYALRTVVLRPLFVHLGLLEVVFEVSHSNSAVCTDNSLDQLLVFKVDSFSLVFLG